MSLCPGTLCHLPSSELTPWFKTRDSPAQGCWLPPAPPPPAPSDLGWLYRPPPPPHAWWPGGRSAGPPVPGYSRWSWCETPASWTTFTAALIEERRLVAPALMISCLSSSPTQADKYRVVSPALWEESLSSWWAPSPLMSTSVKAGLRRSASSGGSDPNRDRRNHRPPPNHSEGIQLPSGLVSVRTDALPARTHNIHTLQTKALPKLRHTYQCPQKGKCWGNLMGGGCNSKILKQICLGRRCNIYKKERLEAELWRGATPCSLVKVDSTSKGL